MAEQSVQANPRKEESGQSRNLSRRSPSGLFGYDPFWSPSEFFSGSPFSLMRRFAEHMDQAFRGDWESGFGGQQGTWFPAVDVAERDNRLVVRADLPGMSRDDVKVELLENSLVIHGERRNEHEEEKGGYRRTERRYGSFYRTIPLPEGAQADQARAEFRDGVLEVSVPMSATHQQRGRQIPIEAGTSERKETGSGRSKT
jgi:HSP20 family protein